MRTISKFRKRTAAAIALSAAVLAALPAQAGEGHLKSMSFNAESAWTTVRVISTDGQSWDKIKSGPVEFWGHMKADMRWPGYVHEVGVVLGACGAGLCQSFPRIFFDRAGVRDYNHQRNFSFDASRIPVSGTGIPVLHYGDDIISRCNQHLQADGPTKSHSFDYEMSATFVIDTGKRWNLDNVFWEAHAGDWPHMVHDVDHSRSDTFSVNVVCEPVIKPPTSELTHDFGEFDVENVKLFLTTYHTMVPGSNQSTICPGFKVTARAQANKPGPVSMRLWEMKNGGPITQSFHQVWASFDATRNGYFATYQKSVNVGATATFQYKVEVEDGTPFGPFDGWKSITVHCTGAGGGGLAPVPQNDPDNPPPQASWQGEVTVADSAGANKQCPRKGQVFFKATRAAPGNFTYKLSCSNGASFDGTATAYDQGSGVFEAYDAHDLSINRTRSIACTLQEVKDNGTRVTIATDSHDFTCANRAIDDLPGDLVAEVPQNPARPAVPSSVATPKPECGPRQALVRGRCVNKPSVSILCAPGFELKGKRCARKPVVAAACKRGETRVNGRCVKKPSVSILCKPGFELKGKRCARKPVVAAACKRGETRVNGRCVKKPSVSILCKPGFELKGKRCARKPVVAAACKRGETRVNGRCVKKPSVSILCKPGYKLVRNSCVPDRKAIAPAKRLGAKKAVKPARAGNPMRGATPRRVLRRTFGAGTLRTN